MLEKELKYFQDHLDEWLKTKEGMFVLIKDEEVVGFFARIEDALSESANLWGQESFLVKKIEKKTAEPIYIPALTLGILHADT